MTAAHTPGPWEAIGHSVRAPCVKYSFTTVAQCLTGLKTAHEVAANARIIAAAPDMLQALVKSYEELACGNVNSAAERIAHAIERATGGAA